MVFHYRKRLTWDSYPSRPVYRGSQKKVNPGNSSFCNAGKPFPNGKFSHTTAKMNAPSVCVKRWIRPDNKAENGSKAEHIG
ncbi:hypothetical protein JCM12296A_48670 [Desulfosarcina cetonica]